MSPLCPPVSPCSLCVPSVSPHVPSMSLKPSVSLCHTNVSLSLPCSLPVSPLCLLPIMSPSCLRILSISLHPTSVSMSWVSPCPHDLAMVSAGSTGQPTWHTSAPTAVPTVTNAVSVTVPAVTGAVSATSSQLKATGDMPLGGYEDIGEHWGH